MTYIDDIKRLRKEAGITQEEMGAKLNMNQASYGRLENGKTEMRISYLKRIASALGKKVMVIFYE